MFLNPTLYYTSLRYLLSDVDVDVDADAGYPAIMVNV